ncbi:MAG: SPFH domain-containing protein [Verrucomicrobiota bacterium]
MDYLILSGAVVLIFFGALIAFVSRYRKCPSDKILVVYGKVGGGRSANCHHGGAAFIWPVIQDYQFLDLTPLPIDIKLEGALSKQNIRVNTPSTFTVGISTESGIMENAAERLLGLSLAQIKELSKDIIFGQMRVVIATMDIEEINADRDKLIANITLGVEVELKKVGLRLINVNVQDITDSSGYIDALGQEAASKAVNEAKIKVAEADRDGHIGAAMAQKDQRIQVSDANAEATRGENVAAVEIANSNADRRTQEAEAERIATAAEKVASAKALEEAYASEKTAENERAERDKATQYADIVVPAEIEKKRIETLAEAEAEETRRKKRGEADGVQSLLEAEAIGQQAILSRKAAGISDLVRASGGNPELASLLMVTEQLPNLIAEQVKAISNLKIDSVTVWDSGSGNGSENGKGSTAQFLSGLAGALPPLHELTRNAGVKLPEYLGKVIEDPKATEELLAQAKSKIAKETSIRDAISTWIENNQSILKEFDTNNDNQLDSMERYEIIDTVMKWVPKAKDTQQNWLYGNEEGRVDGPVPWSQIEQFGAQRPKFYINPNEGSIWLPYELVKIALDS